MTAAETKLLESVHDIEVIVARIEEACKPCSKRVDDHDVILRGPPGNGTRPGLELQVATMTHAHEEMQVAHKNMQKAHLSSAKWQRRQLGAVITAFLAAMALIVNHWINGGGATP